MFSSIRGKIKYALPERAAIVLRSKRRVVLSGSETEKEARVAEKQPVAIPKFPTFSSVHEERVHMKQRMAAGFRLLAKLGWAEGIAGHMTFRDPEYPEMLWVNRFGQYFGHIKASDLILIDHEGAIVRGSHTVNKAAFVIHAAVHGARDNIICAVHAHSLYGKTFSSLGRKLLPISQDACAFYNAHSVYEDFGGVVYQTDEGERLVQALGPNNKAVILRNHGLLTTGTTVDSAIWNFITMESCCQSQLIAEAALKDGYKGLQLIEPEVASQTFKNIGDDQMAYTMFQPYYDMIVKEQPDCLL